MRETRKSAFIILLFSFFFIPSISAGKDLPKIAIWDLAARGTPTTHAQELTSILVSEVSKLDQYEVYSQENIRTLAGWTEERMKLGCTNTQCLTALGQMDVAKLISGSVGKIGNTYSISLNLFDTQNAKAEKAISEFCRSEDELIPLIQQAARKLLGRREIISSAPVPPPSPKPGQDAVSSLPTPSLYRQPGREEFMSAGNWRPSRPITFVVPFAAGGATDILARSAGSFGEKNIGQPIVVVNKPGGGGVIGTSSVAKAKPDGYTLLFGYGGAADLIASHLLKPPYDTLRDFVPICRLSVHSVALIVRADASPNTLSKFIEWGANKTIQAAVPGIGSAGDIILRAFGIRSRLRMQPVPFAGDGPSITALLGGHVDCAGTSLPAILSLIKAKKCIPLAVALDQRNPILPDVPTFQELGYNLANTGLNYGVAAPRGTPDEIIQFFAFMFKNISENPEFAAVLQKMGQPVMYLGPQGFGQNMKSKFEEYGALIQRLGIPR